MPPYFATRDDLGRIVRAHKRNEAPGERDLMKYCFGDEAIKRLQLKSLAEAVLI